MGLSDVAIVASYSQPKPFKSDTKKMITAFCHIFFFIFAPVF